MENKYYIPEIEEFHIGFIHELYLPKFNTWEIKLGLKGKLSLSSISKHLKDNRIRIKYLDKEDIESLGWKHLGENIFIWKESIKDKYFPEPIFNLILNWHHTPNKLEIRCSHPSIEFGGFYGLIKNKSELRKIMKQLGIND